MYPKSTKTERFRGGLDIIKGKSTALSVEKTHKLSADFPSVQNPIVDHLKVTHAAIETPPKVISTKI